MNRRSPSRRRPLRALCRTLSAALPAMVPPCLQAQAPEQPAQIITTDTVEYCEVLEDMVVRRGSHLPEVRKLLIEGRLMCEHGDVRPGIARLRQALVLSHHGRPVPRP